MLDMVMPCQRPDNVNISERIKIGLQRRAKAFEILLA